MRVVPLIELNSMHMLKVSILNNRYRLIFIDIVNHHLFVGTPHYADVALNFSIVKRESRDVLSIRMLKRLNELVKTSLLQSLNVVTLMIIVRKLELIKI
jgi:hypothetical protein